MRLQRGGKDFIGEMKTTRVRVLFIKMVFINNYDLRRHRDRGRPFADAAHIVEEIKPEAVQDPHTLTYTHGPRPRLRTRRATADGARRPPRMPPRGGRPSRPCSYRVSALLAHPGLLNPAFFAVV